MGHPQPLWATCSNASPPRSAAGTQQCAFPLPVASGKEVSFSQDSLPNSGPPFYPFQLTLRSYQQMMWCWDMGWPVGQRLRWLQGLLELEEHIITSYMCPTALSSCLGEAGMDPWAAFTPPFPSLHLCLPYSSSSLSHSLASAEASLLPTGGRSLGPSDSPPYRCCLQEPCAKG